MPQVDVNLMAVLIAALLSMVIGAVWYSKLLFGNKWMALVGKKEEDLREGAGQSYVGSSFAAIITAYVLAHIVVYAQADSLAEGVQTGFWIWLGFVFTTHLVITLFEDRNKQLFLINAAYNLVTLGVMGAILATWS